MYPTVDVHTALTFARLHQDDVHGSFSRRSRDAFWLLRRTGNPTRARTLTPAPAPAPTPHRPAAA
jgi:hypothetical protein